MPLPTTDTQVTYPDGALTSTGTVLHVEPLADGRSAVLLDRTAFHPVGTAWPDQPADHGVMRTAEGELPIVDGLTGGIHDGVLVLGRDLPVRTGTPDWTFVVAHIVAGAGPAEGDSVEVVIDEERRAALSRSHTACHLAALALDATLAIAWRKPVQVDPLGNPSFDSLAMQESRIEPDHSTDTYRIGKSLRRKGFDPTVLNDPAAIADRVNAQIAAWIAGGGDVCIEHADNHLSGRRAWVCTFSDGRRAEFPCGGTHVTSLGALASVTVQLETIEVVGGLELVMRTATTAA